MGQWLVIGIATRIVAEKKEAKRHLFGDYVTKTKEMLRYRFNGRGIYDLAEDEETVTLTLKESIAKEQWVRFVRDFLRLRYGDEDKDGIIARLEQHDDLKAWMEIAKEKVGRETYLYDHLMWYPLTGEGEHDHLLVSVDYVILSITGKIIMECYADLFDFFARLIRDRMPGISLADGVIVSITD